ncbi:MAG TPA: phytanoyl-CoA dioxygenase family protein [Planctomycetaceae bacterium]|nr:phytanoyl-CoA dioxygenase family protein [Planctomycetaceae bacterium]
MSDQPTSFKMIPDQAELDALERDLTFYPSVNEAPKVLTREQIDRFNSQGYFQPLTIFSDSEINDIREYFDRLLEQYLAEGGDSYSISSAHLRHGRVWDLLNEPRIVDVVSDLLGENVIGWGSHFFCKMPGDGKQVAWHQDASYWPLSPSKAITVWLAIDDADPENANMRFIEGSHKFGHMTYQPSDSTEHNVLNQTIANPEQYGTPVDNPLKAGQISVHSDLLLHGSEANNSDRRRCALTLRYAAAEVRAGLGWNGKGVWVRGGDPSGHWANRGRPEEE